MMKTIFLFLALTLSVVAQNLHPVIVIVNASNVVKANQAAKLIDVDRGEFTFSVPLTRNGVDTLAYWCNWQMTVGDAVNIRARIQERTGLAFTTPVPGKWLMKKGATPIIAAYDAERWTPEQVLADWNLHPFTVTP